MHVSLWCRPWAPTQAGNVLGGVCLSPMKKTVGVQRGKKIPNLSPVLAMGGETGALPLHKDALCSPNTESSWGSPVLFSVPPPQRAEFSPRPPHASFSKDCCGSWAPQGSKHWLQCRRQPASSKRLTALLSHHIMMDEPYSMEMSPSEQSMSSFPSASYLSTKPAGMNSPCPRRAGSLAWPPTF